MKNRAYHSVIKRSPYEAMFGCSAKVGLSSSIIPQNVLHSINAEEDLEKLEDSRDCDYGITVKSYSRGHSVIPWFYRITYRNTRIYR